MAPHILHLWCPKAPPLEAQPLHKPADGATNVLHPWAIHITLVVGFKRYRLGRSTSTTHCAAYPTAAAYSSPCKSYLSRQVGPLSRAVLARTPSRGALGGLHAHLWQLH